MRLVALTAGIALLALAGRISGRRRSAPALRPASGAEARSPRPEVTAVLPVRDEEENVEACVRSLRAQAAPLTVVVVDDGSTDRTREIVRGLVAVDERIALVDAPPLPPGWKGKVHALHLGLAEVDTPWVLATDADTRHEPELLPRVLATAEALGLDSLSLAGRQEVRGAGENLITPVVFALLDALLGDWGVAARGGTDAANGQYFLVRTRALRAIGGFASLRGAALDDVTLARRLRARGFRHGFLRAPGLLRVRMYRGSGATFRGWRRNFGALFAGRARPAAGALALLLAPAALLGTGLLRGERAAAGVLWACGAAASAILRRGSDHPPLYGLLYPLDALATALCLALGLRDAARGSLAPWKGRPVRLDAE